MNIGMRWLLFPGIDTLCFDISLFVLQIPIRTIIVFLRNLFTVSCIVEICCKVETTKNVDIIMREDCMCSICKCQEAKLCLQVIMFLTTIIITSDMLFQFL